MRTVRTTFQEVTQRSTRRAKCERCGKMRTRTHVVTHTINPWNKNKDGSVRTREQVAKCVAEELAAELRGPHVCKGCS